MENTNKKNLLVIAEERSVLIWEMAGAKGLVFDPQKIRETFNEIKAHSMDYKAALIGESVYEKGTQIVRLLNDLEIPWIMLLDQSNDEKIGYKELQRLSEKAIGMSLAIH
jgi:vacuolar-type H+-ATPase subunit F/Vma7